eukprot:11682910-Heterocapsa_arctica.AAC.1
MLQGERPTQTLSPVDVDRLGALEALTEEALAGAEALAAPPESGANDRRLRERVSGIARQLLCELDC